MEYLILEGDDANQLSNAVRIHIADGWKPQGGVSVSLSGSDQFMYQIFAQAMIKETPMGEMPS